MRESDLLSR